MKRTKTKEALEKLKHKSNAKSYYDLAIKLGKPTSSLQRYKDGSSSITLEKLQEFANNVNLELNIEFKEKNS